jgi:hypothetical protein
MNYELAKKLKDNGFPYDDPCQKVRYVDQHDNPARVPFMGVAEIPSLSELIEACGDELGDLSRTDDGWMTNMENVGNHPQTEGETAEIAVANLWLALQTTK